MQQFPERVEGSLGSENNNGPRVLTPIVWPGQPTTVAPQHGVVVNRPDDAEPTAKDLEAIEQHADDEDASDEAPAEGDKPDDPELADQPDEPDGEAKPKPKRTRPAR